MAAKVEADETILRSIRSGLKPPMWCQRRGGCGDAPRMAATGTGAGPASTSLTQEGRGIFRICDTGEFHARNELAPYLHVLRLIARSF